MNFKSIRYESKRPSNQTSRHTVTSHRPAPKPPVQNQTSTFTNFNLESHLNSEENDKNMAEILLDWKSNLRTKRNDIELRKISKYYTIGAVA